MSEPSEIAVWLGSLGLDQYAAAFEANHITIAMLPGLTTDELKECGVTALGHRKAILGEIAKLAAKPSAATAKPPALAPATAKPATPRPAAPPPVRAPIERGPLRPIPVAKAADEPSMPVAQPVPPPPRKPEALPAAPPVSVSPIAPPLPPPSRTPAYRRPGFWARLAASKFLFISIIAHLLFGLGATYFIVQRIQAKRKVTFKGGPPSANPSKRALEHKVSMAQKKKTGGAPPQAKRIVSAGIAKVSLPDLPTIPTASTVVPGMMAGLGGAGFGTGTGFGSGAGGGMGGGGGGGGGMTLFGFRGAGTGLVGTFYDLKQKRNKQPSGVNQNNYTGIVRKWVDGGMRESEMDDYFKAPNKLSTSQFMIPDMPAEGAPKAYGVEKEVKPAQWLAVYRGRVQAPKEGTYHFIGAADDVLLVRVNGKLVLDASWEATSSLKPEEIIAPRYVGFPRGGYIRGEGVRFSGTSWSDIEVVIGERPGGRFWGVLMVQESGGGKDGKIPLFRLANAKFPKSDGPPFPNCDLNGPLWRVQAASGGSLLDALKR